MVLAVIAAAVGGSSGLGAIVIVAADRATPR